MGCRIVSGSCHPAEWKIATLQLSSGCHPMERSWMEEVATRLPVDHPLPDDGLEWRTRAPIGPSRSSPYSRLLPD
ncbi:unnamed protein product [Spirodela intermedia]|uniref:Uncharacterized protein n=1 Tax=Spirodela intermedia TaxID=51605 RepID=A0A7I8IUI9_SPIIN|nr:unnamed protein product [Spirodela intermedia]CAA6661547.1 unnamed protein product [Spirodela intermedia]